MDTSEKTMREGIQRFLVGSSVGYTLREIAAHVGSGPQETLEVLQDMQRDGLVHFRGDRGLWTTR